MRTIIEIPDTLINRLKSLLEQKKISRAELIRRAITEYLQRHQVDDNAAFGSWKNQKIDGLTYQTNLRDEW